MLQLALTVLIYLIMVIPVGIYLYHIAAGKHTFADPVFDRADRVIYSCLLYTSKAVRRYTCGHFPQSFEYSSVGGWVVTRGAGQNSTYYGCITDIVAGQKYATPIGTVTTSTYPREATGPNLNPVSYTHLDVYKRQM